MDNYEGNELTAIAFDAAVPARPERRSEERRTALLRIGKLIARGEQRLCMIRNLSTSGAMLKLYQPLAADERVTIEIAPDNPVEATVIWTDVDLAGLRFDETIDIARALRGDGGGRPYRRVARTPRLRVRRGARICTAECEEAVTLCDVSLNGAKIETGAVLEPGAEIALFVEGLPALAGQVRWYDGTRAGIEFDMPMPIDTLGAWIGS